MAKVVLALVMLSLLGCGLSYNEAIDDVIDKIMNAKNDVEPMISKRSSSVGGQQCSDENMFPESSTIQTSDSVVDSWVKTPTHCSPQSFSFPIPAKRHLTIFPHRVDLKRCYGSPTLILQRCVATKKERVKVHYYEVSGSNYINKSKVMYEHTACTSECIVKASDCRPGEIYVADQCQCQCTRPNNFKCTNSLKIYKEQQCGCVCQSVLPCKDPYREFNPETCTCDCARCIQDMCTKSNLVLDTKHCRCQQPQS